MKVPGLDLIDDDDLGGGLVRWAIFFGWPMVWLAAKARLGIGALALSARGVGSAALASGSGSAELLPAPWEVAGPVTRVICDVAAAVWLTLS